nr:hypothetical protein [Tanacetum cinerariifolium]
MTTIFNTRQQLSVSDSVVLAPSQSAFFPTSYFSPFIIPKDFYTNLVYIPGGTDLVTGADLVTGTDLVTGDDLEVGTDLAAGNDLEAGNDLVKEAGTDLVTQAGTDLVTLSD